MSDFPTSLLYIDGALRPAEGGRSFGVETPVSGSIVGQAADATAADVDAAIAAARRAFDTSDWSTNLSLRTAALRRWQTAMGEIADDWRDRIMAESGCTRLMSHMLHLDAPIAMMAWTIAFAEGFEWQRDIGIGEALGIMEAAAPTLKRVFLELGDKSANIVLDDALFPSALEGGLGREMGHEGFEEYLQTKTVSLEVEPA